MTIIAQPSDLAAELVATLATETVDLPRLYANPGLKDREFHVGDRFRLTTRTGRTMPTHVYADRASSMSHLDGKDTGHTWSSPDEEPNSLEFSFTYLGEYEYVGAALDQTSLEVVAQFQRVSA